MNRTRNPIPYLLVILCLMALILLCTARIMSAQILRQGDIEIIPGSLGLPCEPGESGFYPCPPVENQGVLIQVRSDDWRTGEHESYSVTITYRTAAGERKTAAGTVKRERDFGKDWDDGWRAVGFNVGRVATGPLPGITVESVAVAKVPRPVVITIGSTEIGAPK